MWFVSHQHWKYLDQRKFVEPMPFTWVIYKTSVTQLIKGTQYEPCKVFVMEFTSGLCYGWKHEKETIQSGEEMSGVMIQY